MKRDFDSFFDDFFVSGHYFDDDEILLKFQYKVLNTVLLVMVVFTFIFAFLSSIGLNPLGVVQTVSNYILVVVSSILMYGLRASKSRYLPTAYMMYVFAFMAFVSALLFVPHDEFRIIWFYLLVFAAYITGGVKAGNIVSIVSISTVIIINFLHDLQLSQTAIVSSILGLIIATLFFRAYTKKIIDFEKEISEQKSIMIEQSRFAAMGEMMSMIAHQWRQPLSTTTLMISNERLKSMLDGKEANKYDDMLDKISETMIYLSDTIDDFQTYFKSNKSSQKVSMEDLVKGVLQFTDARMKLAKVKIDIKQDHEFEIYTCKNELVQVLINIINNSIDALIENRKDNRKILLSVDELNESAVIKIEDNGGGIQEDIIDKIFEPYFSTKSKNGTGLGLYMSKLIIDKHAGGTIEVKNSSHGACFSIVIPKRSSEKDLDD